jgi:hypothetical protein
MGDLPQWAAAARCEDGWRKKRWNPIESAPFDQDVTLQVTDGRGKPYYSPEPKQAYRVRLDQLQQGNAIGGDAGEVEAVLPPAASIAAGETGLKG